MASCLWWTNSWYARNRVAAKLQRTVEHLKHRSGQPCDYDAMALIAAARRAVKYDHGLVYAGGLKQYRPTRRTVMEERHTFSTLPTGVALREYTHARLLAAGCTVTEEVTFMTRHKFELHTLVAVHPVTPTRKERGCVPVTPEERAGL